MKHLVIIEIDHPTDEDRVLDAEALAERVRHQTGSESVKVTVALSPPTCGLCGLTRLPQ